jgi:hypothetical protein
VVSVSKTISRIYRIVLFDGDLCFAKAAGPMTVAWLEPCGFRVEDDLTH